MGSISGYELFYHILQSRGGPFLEWTQEILSGKPYYSARFSGLLSQDRITPTGPTLARGEWSLVNVYPRYDNTVDMANKSDTYEYTGGRWQRKALFDVDLEFRSEDAEVFGFYKVHMMSTGDLPPTQGNSQRKIAQEYKGTFQHWYHAAYVSGGRIWYTWTEDNGDTWEPEVLISDFYHTSSKPCIAVKNEDTQSNNPSDVYISYVDHDDGTVVLKRRRLTDRPDAWATVDAITLWNAADAHPVINTSQKADNNICVLVYEGDHELRYSVYDALSPMVADLSTSQGVTSNVTFRDRLYVDGYVNWRGKVFQPELPCMTDDGMCSGPLEVFPVVWREGDYGSMRAKNLLVEAPSPPSSRTVYESDPALIPTHGLYIDPNAGPSITMHCGPGYTHLAYECQNQGTFPSPSNIPTMGLTTLNRTFYPVTGLYPIVSSGGPTVGAPGTRVAIKRGNGMDASIWTQVTQVVNLPHSNIIRPEPVIGTDVTGRYVSLNYASHKTATVKFDQRVPSVLSAVVRGIPSRYPAVSATFLPLEIHSVDNPWEAPPSLPSNWLWNPIEYSVMETTSGLRKTSSLLVSDPLRELVVRKNDSSYAMFGVVKPHVIANGENYTEIAWDASADSLDYHYWGDIGRCIRTMPFTVPTGGAVEYGNELYAEYPADLDSSMIVLVRFRDANSHQVLFENSIDMSGYQGDTALYVLDRHDLSNIGGSTVYMCIELADTSSAVWWEVQVINSIDTLQQEKAVAHEAPRPTGVTLEQNAPNPFNPTTSISYGIESDAHVELLIYDHLGRNVATLVQQHTAAGRHRVTFDARNLPSGVYYYRLSALGHSLTRKMTLLR
jgi:hypothetical protein